MMFNLKKWLPFTFLLFVGYVNLYAQSAPFVKDDFKFIDLKHKGLEKVDAAVNAGKYEQAAKLLLAYYRNKKEALVPNTAKKPNANTLKLADDILLHKFKPHRSYPVFDYGKDINWQYRPVKDQILSTFLHRTVFWESLGTAYLGTADEKYAKEWVFQLLDYIKKNPQGAYPDDKDFAWKAFVVSFRLNHWSTYFYQFVNSPNFTPAVLMQFLKSYNEQANYVINNYSDVGNHLLYEALHLMYAGSYFPELKDAQTWRKSGIAVLNKEITKQALPDGMQYELSTSYHIGTIGTFLNALKTAQNLGIANEFPASYRNTIEKMVMAVGKYSFPDYTFPLHGNSFATNKETMLKNYQLWASVFPNNQEIAYFASDGKSGEKPKQLSTALPNAGFYAFRNGLDSKATVMQIKIGPPAFFHSHPDNGNFELWIKGRNFTPDAGSFIYANVGDQKNAKRDWYRSTKAHQTLTLNDQNIENNAKVQKWEPNGSIELLSYTNPSYKTLAHQRSFLFIDGSYFLIIDRAVGGATGKLGVHFNLQEKSEPVINKKNNSFYTTYADGNNLLIQNLNKDVISLSAQESFVSYQYQVETPRPAFVFEKQKNSGATETFISIVYPFSGKAAPKITLTENKGNNYEVGHIDVNITINGLTKHLKTTL